MKIRLLLATLAGAASLAPAICAAQSSSTRDTGWEFGADVVYQLSDKTDFDGGSKLDLEDDVGLTLTWGYRFNPKLQLDFSLDWNTVDYDGVLQSASFPGITANVHGDMETFTPRINVTYNLIDGPLTPFVKAGIGWSFIDTNIPTGQVQIGCWWDPWYGQICTPYQNTKNTDAFSYEAAIGGRWDIGSALSILASYERAWFDFNNATSTPGLDRFRIGFMYRLDY